MCVFVIIWPPIKLPIWWGLIFRALTLWVQGGLFRPRVIKMLAISKPMIQLALILLDFSSIDEYYRPAEKNYMHFSDNFMLFHIIL